MNLRIAPIEIQLISGLRDCDVTAACRDSRDVLGHGQRSIVGGSNDEEVVLVVPNNGMVVRDLVDVYVPLVPLCGMAVR